MKKIILLVTVIAITFISCRKELDEKQEEQTLKTMSDLEVSDSFNWRTTKDLVINFTTTENGIVYVNSVDGNTFHKAMLTANNDYISKTTIPSYVKKVELVFNGKNYDLVLENNKIEYDFN